MNCVGTRLKTKKYRTWKSKIASHVMFVCFIAIPAVIPAAILGDFSGVLVLAGIAGGSANLYISDTP